MQFWAFYLEGNSYILLMESNKNRVQLEGWQIDKHKFTKNNTVNVLGDVDIIWR